MTAIFDNSESNPRNPNRSAKRITWGEQSTDEMCLAFLGWTKDAEHLNLQAPTGSSAYRWPQPVLQLRRRTPTIVNKVPSEDMRC